MSLLNILCFLLVIGTISAKEAEKKVCDGCPKTEDVTDSEIKSRLKKIVSAQNGKSEEPINVVSITKATTQVVSGVKYTYDFIGEGEKSMKRYSCHTEFILQEWISRDPQVIEYSCKPQKKKRSLHSSLRKEHGHKKHHKKKGF